MKEKQKDPKLTSGSSGSQQKQNSQPNEGSSKKSSGQPTGSFVSLEGSKSETEMEQDARDHQDENKTPVGYKTGKEQTRGQNESVSNSPGKNEGSSKSGNLNKSSSGKKN